MIDIYRKYRNASAIGYVVSMVCAIWRRPLLHVFEGSGVSILMAYITLGLLVATCWFWLKAKKRSGLWLMLLPANLIALLVYALLEDRSEEPDLIRCAKCTTANFPEDSHCRFCKEPLVGPVS